MSPENSPDNLNNEMEDIGFENDDLYYDDPGILAVERNLDRLREMSSVEAVYGKPVKSGTTLIIPTAEVVSMMGFGVGSGSSGEEAGGSGGGGGGMNLSRPVAVVIASPEGVRVEPVVDVTKIGIAALTTLGFMFSMIARTLSHRRA